MQFYRGEDHYWKGKGTVGYAVSDDDGRTWQEQPDAVSTDRTDIYDRFAAFGRARSGKLITLFARRRDPRSKPQLFQTVSTDEGNSWQRPSRANIIKADSDALHLDWMHPYGPIKVTPAGALVAMAYVAADNYVLISKDDGATWHSHLVISSEAINYSEMGVEILSEGHWLAVSRIDNKMNRMAQFETNDAGQTWELKGPLDIPESNRFAAPSIDAIFRESKKSLLLAYCDRIPRKCWMREADGNTAKLDPRAWGVPVLLDEGFIGLSGYQSILQSLDRRDLIVAITRERSTAVSDIVIWRTPLPATLGRTKTQGLDR
jgi:hypothetical protein